MAIQRYSNCFCRKLEKVIRIVGRKAKIQPYHVGVYGVYKEAIPTRPPYVPRNILPLDFFEFQIRSIHVRSIHGRGGTKIAVNPHPQDVIKALEELKRQGKTTIVQIWFWDDTKRLIAPDYNTFSNLAKRRIDEVLRETPVTKKRLCDYTDIIFLAEENPYSGERPRLLKELYTYVKSKCKGTSVYQYLSDWGMGKKVWREIANYTDGVVFSVYWDKNHKYWSKSDLEQHWKAPKNFHKPIIFHIHAADEELVPWSENKWKYINEMVEFTRKHNIAVAWYTKAWWTKKQKQDPINIVIWDALLGKSKEIQRNRPLGRICMPVGHCQLYRWKCLQYILRRMDALRLRN